MAEKSLESFKIGDKHKPRVTKSVTAVKEKPAEAAYTLGFARIEGILDEEEPGAVADKLNQMLADLDELDSRAKTPKDRSASKKARAAVERTIDLLEYLFRTKAALQDQAVKPEK